MAIMQQIIEQGRTIRDRHKISMRTPLPGVVLVHSESSAMAAVARLKNYIIDELNVREVKAERVLDVPHLVRFKCMPNHKALGARFGTSYKQVQAEIRGLDHEQLATFSALGKINVSGNAFSRDDIVVSLEYAGDAMTCDAEPCEGGLVILSRIPDRAMLNEATAREVCAKVQKMRKETGLLKSDEIEVSFSCAAGQGSGLHALLLNLAGYIAGRVGRPLLSMPLLPECAVPLAIKEGDVKLQTVGGDGALLAANELLTLSLCRGCVFFNNTTLKSLLPDEALRAGVQQLVAAKDFQALKAEIMLGNGILCLILNGTKVVLQLGQHFFLSSSEARLHVAIS